MGKLGYAADRVAQTLREAGYRVTPARRAVIDAVIAKNRHFTGADIVEEVVSSNRQVGRATVFRTLEVLVNLGLVGRIHHPSGGSGYVLCPQGHHHHVICSQCGLVVDIPGCPLGSQAESDALAMGFRLEGHRLEYYGICQTCQEKGAS